MKRRVFVASLGLLLCACVTSRSGKPVHTFPSRTDLDQIAAKTATAPGLDPKMSTVESWTVESTAAGSYPNEAPWDATFLELAQASGAKPEASMRCVAQETARVYASTASGPDVGLSRFIAGRCGSLVEHPQIVHWQPELEEGTDLSAAFAHWAPRLRDEIPSLLSGTGLRAGFSVHREGTKVVMVLAKGTPEVELESFSQLVNDESKLVLRGRLRADAVALFAHINHGTHGVRTCDIDAALSLPDFRVTCVLAAEDDNAWVGVSALAPGRVLSNSVLSVLALRSETAARKFVRRELGEARPADNDEQFRASVLQLVNEVRAQVHLNPLVLAEKQSASVSAVALPFFNAMFAEGKEDPETVNQITLGLMAGWDVTGGLIRGARLYVHVQAAQADAARWLSDVLEQPFGRLALLDAEAKTLALGARVQHNPNVVAAISVSYLFHEPESKPGARAMKVLERLARIRSARGLGGTMLVADLSGVPDALADIEAGKASPAAAMDEALHIVAHDMGQSVRGLVWETTDPENIEFPPELLRHGNLYLGAGVTFYKPAGAAWGQYVVLFVIVNGPQGGQA